MIIELSFKYQKSFTKIASNVVLLFFLLFVTSCEKDSNPLDITSNIYFSDENELNHLNYEISAKNSILNETVILDFSNESILLNLQISGFENGSGNLQLLNSADSILSNVSFNSDLVFRDTLNSTVPSKFVITFKDFTGIMKYQVDAINK